MDSISKHVTTDTVHLFMYSNNHSQSVSPAKSAARVAVMGGRRAARGFCLPGFGRVSLSPAHHLCCLRASLLPILLPPKHALY